MPITPVTFPNHYTLTVETTNNTLTDTWRNSMDLVYTVGDVPTPSDAPVLAFYAFLQGIMRSDCHLSHASMRLWARGDQPFSTQAAIWESTLSLPGFCYGTGGAVGSVGDHNPTVGEVVAEWIKPIFTGGGKPGRLFTRNTFRDIDITAVAGGPPILTGTVPGPNAANLNAYASTTLATYCEDNPLPRFCIVHWSKLHAPTAPFESTMRVPVFSKPGMHDLSHKSPK
jgi:hypothetical protein